MNIWLDLRFLKKWDIYSNFVFKIIQLLIKENTEINYNIYVDFPFSHINLWKNTKNKIINEKPWSFKEQTNFLKVLNNNKNDLVIFFNYKKPFWYKKKYILVISDLAEFHYPPIKSFIQKYFDNFLLNNSTRNANKIICFNQNTKIELNDKLNISEDKIKILTPFYNKKNVIKSDPLNMDLNAKYNIKSDYFIYNAWHWNHKNLERLIEIFSNIKKEKSIETLCLIILDDYTVKDVNIRKKIIDSDTSDVIYFIWNINDKEKEIFYKYSKWTIYPVLYESFPFLLEEPLNYNTKILASNLDNIKDIFWDTINYFSPSNNFDMYDKIISLSKAKKRPNYKKIFEENNLIDCSNKFINLIKGI